MRADAVQCPSGLSVAVQVAGVAVAVVERSRSMAADRRSRDGQEWKKRRTHARHGTGWRAGWCAHCPAHLQGSTPAKQRNPHGHQSRLRAPFRSGQALQPFLCTSRHGRTHSTCDRPGGEAPRRCSSSLCSPPASRLHRAMQLTAPPPEANAHCGGPPRRLGLSHRVLLPLRWIAPSPISSRSATARHSHDEGCHPRPPRPPERDPFWDRKSVARVQLRPHCISHHLITRREAICSLMSCATRRQAQASYVGDAGGTTSAPCSGLFPECVPQQRQAPAIHQSRTLALSLSAESCPANKHTLGYSYSPGNQIVRFGIVRTQCSSHIARPAIKHCLPRAHRVRTIYITPRRIVLTMDPSHMGANGSSWRSAALPTFW